MAIQGLLQQGHRAALTRLIKKAPEPHGVIRSHQRQRGSGRDTDSQSHLRRRLKPAAAIKNFWIATQYEQFPRRAPSPFLPVILNRRGAIVKRNMTGLPDYGQGHERNKHTSTLALARFHGDSLGRQAPAPGGECGDSGEKHPERFLGAEFQSEPSEALTLIKYSYINI